MSEERKAMAEMKEEPRIYGQEILNAPPDRFFWIVRLEGDGPAARFLEMMHEAQNEAVQALQTGKVRIARWWSVQRHEIQGEGHVFLCARMGGEAEGQIAIPGRKPNGIRL